MGPEGHIWEFLNWTSAIYKSIDLSILNRFDDLISSRMIRFQILSGVDVVRKDNIASRRIQIFYWGHFQDICRVILGRYEWTLHFGEEQFANDEENCEDNIISYQQRQIIICKQVHISFTDYHCYVPTNLMDPFEGQDPLSISLPDVDSL